MSDTSTGKPTVLLFGRESDPNKWLSPHSKHSIVQNDMHFGTMQHWLSYRNALEAGDYDKLKTNVVVRDPVIHYPDDPTWLSKRERILFQAAWLKATKYKDIAVLLKYSGDLVIGYADPEAGDLGTGLPLDHPDAADPTKWTRANALGKAWMEVREAI